MPSRSCWTACSSRSANRWIKVGAEGSWSWWPDP